MKIIESGMLDRYGDVEYLYIFHDLETHKVGKNKRLSTSYAVSRTYYFVSNEKFYKQADMLQEAVDNKKYKYESACLNHVAKLNKKQLLAVQKKRAELQSIQKSAPTSNSISDLIEFHDEVIGVLLEWFNKNNIQIRKKKSTSTLKKKDTKDALWAIADDMRTRKEEGEFDTYREGYLWAEKNMTQNGKPISASKLENAYYKAKSEGRAG